MHTVVLYGRPGCCLCEEAMEVIERVHAGYPDAFQISYSDIECDEQLLRAYLERIPVIEIDGSEAFELFVDERELQLRLGIVSAR